MSERRPLAESGYNTEHEKSFVDGLGSWSNKDELTRLALLRRYQKAIAARTCWGAINRVEIERHLIAAIERETVLQ